MVPTNAMKRKDMRINNKQSSGNIFENLMDQDVLVKKEFEECCRVCLKEGNIPIFGRDDSKNISADFATITGLAIEYYDEFPKHICHACLSLLEGAVLFRNTALKSEIHLKNAGLYEKQSIPQDFSSANQLENYIEPKIEINDYSETNSTFKKVKKRKHHCKRCDLDFKTSKHYEEHKKSDEHKLKRKQCPYCDKIFLASYIKRHIIVHEGGASKTICDFCGKEFLTQYFPRHRLTHIDTLPFKCSTCPYRGRTKNNLQMHIRKHTGERPYQCSQCPARFISKSNLNKHGLTHNNADFKCKECSKTFKTQQSLDAHYKGLHTDIRDHSCDFCDKAFANRKQMMKHQLRVHKRAKLRSGIIPNYLQIEADKNLNTHSI